jgi:hypothetical protein
MTVLRLCYRSVTVSSNPCAFDDIDAKFTNNCMANNSRGFCYGPALATQSELVDARGTNARSYPALNLLKFSGSYHPNLSYHLYSVATR